MVENCSEANESAQALSFTLQLLSEGAATAEALIVVPGAPLSREGLSVCFPGIPAEQKTFGCIGEAPSLDNACAYAAALEAQIGALGIRRFTLLGIGAGAAVVNLLSTKGLRALRRVVLIDPVFRQEPERLGKFIERLQTILPAGLPLAPAGADFRASLHRTRCPALILLTSCAERFLQEETKRAFEVIPNAWLKELAAKSAPNGGPLLDESLWAAIAEFLHTPPKRPQKNEGKGD